MLDRSNQLSHTVGLERLRAGAAFLPTAIFPPKDGRPARVVWLDVGTAPIDEPFLAGDIEKVRTSAAWFVSDLSALKSFSADAAATPPVGGLIFHVARCGSTLARRLLGAATGTMVLSEPSLLNQAIADPSGASIGDVLAAFATVADRRGQSLHVKCTSSNLLESDQILDGRSDVPAIFIHREPGEVLASSHGLDWYQRLPESMRSKRAVADADEGNAAYLEALMRIGLRLAESGRVRCVAYPDIIRRFTDGELPRFFNCEMNEVLRLRMTVLATEYSKSPSEAFRSDAKHKAEIIARSPSIRRAVDRLGPLHRELLRHSEIPRSGW